MVRSTVINAGGKLSIDDMVGVIMRIFVDGIRRPAAVAAVAVSASSSL